MQLKSDKSNHSRWVLSLVILGVVALSVFVLSQTSSETGATAGVSKTYDLNVPTVITAAQIDYTQVLDQQGQQVYKDSLVSLYLSSHMGKPHLIYAYKNPLEGRLQTDLFFLHIYVKDKITLKNQAAYLNLDFFKSPEVITHNGVSYSVFDRLLEHANYPKATLDIDDIAYINTGRYRSGMGRSHDIVKLRLDPSLILQNKYTNSLDSLTLTLKASAFEKIRTKRNDAIARGLLITDDDDYVKGSLSYQGKTLDTELRLKGDWTDHLLDDRKWSYRFLIQDGHTLNGMRKVSVQHPKTRNYLWEWLYNKALTAQDIIGLRYDFVNFTIKTTSNTNIHTKGVGVMALEESFDKILIEHNRRRAGVIVAFDESYLWNERAKEYDLNLPVREVASTLQSARIAPIKVYNQNKVLSDPALAKQFATAKSMLDGLRKGDYKISEVFDLDKLSSFVALTNLFGGAHGMIWHNIRVYYNPITNKLEPISYDSNSGVALEGIIQYPFSEKDPIYTAAVLEKLERFSQNEFVNTLIATHKTELLRLNKDLSYELGNGIDLTILEHNSNFIKKAINPSDVISAGLHSIDEQQLEVALENLSDYPVAITGLSHTDGRTLGTTTKDSVVLGKRQKKTIRFDLNRYFVNAFVSKKNKKGSFNYPKDVAKLRVNHQIEVIDLPRKAPIAPFALESDLQDFTSTYKDWETPNYDSFDFIIKDSENSLRIARGAYTLDQTLVIPKSKVLTIEAGVSLDFKKGASLISKSAIKAIGTATSPIVFESKDHSGGGIFVDNTNTISTLTHCVFESLSYPSSELWNLSGGVNFHESEVKLDEVTFKNNRSEDALNIIRSSFVMTNSQFENTQSDAFDGDFVDGRISNSTFTNAGNDGIDISGSILYLEDITVVNPSDKAISAGENSQISGQNIVVNGGEIGVVSKDLSRVELKNLRITNTRLGLSAFQKKSEYGTATITINDLLLTNVEEAHLIEVDSQLLIDGEAVTTVSNSVIDQMYGKEYGKSSR